jgi:shikimate kinase
MKIFLIGMPGSGKSTLGKEVAKALSVPFIDLDDEIENKEGRPIPEIFSEQGEEHFRKLESTTLKQQSEQHESFVMATGGGAPCFLDGMNVINASGVSIFLDVSLKELLSRNEMHKHRPLLQGDAREKLKKLYHARLTIYKQANHVIQGDAISSEDILHMLNAKN